MIFDVSFRGWPLAFPRNDFLAKPEVAIRLASEATGKHARLTAILDTGCDRSLFRMGDLALIGFERPASLESRVRFRSITGSEFAGFPAEVTLELTDTGLGPLPMTVHATDQELENNLLGLDFLAHYLAAFHIPGYAAYLCGVEDGPRIVQAS